MVTILITAQTIFFDDLSFSCLGLVLIAENNRELEKVLLPGDGRDIKYMPKRIRYSQW